MCLPNLENWSFSIPIFRPNYPPISIPFLIKKNNNIAEHPILPKLCAFCNNLLKIHPIFFFFFLILAP